MFGIGTKPARFLAAAILALGVGAVGLPITAEAGDGHRRHGGHKFHGHFKQKHFGHKNFGRGHFKQRHFRRHHGHHFHGHHFRRNRGHHHGGFGIHIWRPFPKHHLMSSACHPVVGHGFDAFGRRAKFGGTMCYDRFGNGYVVAGSQHVIHYF